MSGLSLEDIRFALELASEKGYNEIHLRAGEKKFKAVLRRSAVQSCVSQEVESEAAPSSSLSEISAPVVGYFVEADPPLAEGDTVQANQTVGSIDALGLQNPVVATESGRIKEIRVQPNQSVEFGQVLLVVERTP
jgi:biotin carboxyl carrier protein